jgi:hypothetical protein
VNHGKVTGNMVEYRQSSYGLRKAIKKGKCQYKDRVESHFNGPDTIFNVVRIPDNHRL